MLNACVSDLHHAGVICRAEVVFQTGQSRTQRQFCGLYQFDPSVLRFDRIWIYTYRRKVEDVVITIAHEFGHLAHYRTVPGSVNWSNNLMEQYANLWAKAMYNRLYGSAKHALWSERDLNEFRAYMTQVRR